jgi:hypothetical protein
MNCGMDRFEVLLEEVSAQNRAVLGYVKDMPEIKADVKEVNARMGKVEQRLDVIEIASKDHSHEIAVLKSK